MDTDYVKTILYSYPVMGQLAEAIGESVKNRALLSYKGKRDAFDECNAIAEDILLQKELLLLKDATDRFLDGLTEEERFLLEYRFFRRKKYLDEYSPVLACTERGYFRRQEKLLKKVAAYYLTLGLTEEKFLETYKGSVCLMKIYKAVKGGEEFKVCPRRERRVLLFQPSKFSGGTVFLPRATKMATVRRATDASVMSTI